MKFPLQALPHDTIASSYCPPEIEGYQWFGNSNCNTEKEAIDSYLKYYSFDPKLVLVMPFSPARVKWALYYPIETPDDPVTVIDQTS